MEEFKMFDIVYVDLSGSKIGSEQTGIRFVPGKQGTYSVESRLH